LTPFDTRLLELAGDILTAVGRGELQADAPVVRAAGAALAELRRAREAAEEADTGAGASRAPGTGGTPAGSAGSGSATGTRAPRVVTQVEQVLAVAARMRASRGSFASACVSEGAALGTSAQAVRNACTRWLGASAADWQPLAIEGAEAGVVPLARRVAERCPWLADRIASTFGVPASQLADAGGGRATA
jgi:hypothetical protein